jgi:hypothetical protein
MILAMKNRTMKSFKNYNVDLLKHLCVVAKIDKKGWSKFLNLLNPEKIN